MPIQYNLELLNSLVTKFNPKFIDIPDKLNRDVKIDFVCVCGGQYNLTFRNIYEYGLKCKICKLEDNKRKNIVKEVINVVKETIISRNDQVKSAPTKYNLELLNSLVTKFYPQSIDIPDKLTRNIKIDFVCACGNYYNLTFRNINEYGLKCKSCKLEDNRRKKENCNIDKQEEEEEVEEEEVEEEQEEEEEEQEVENQIINIIQTNKKWIHSKNYIEILNKLINEFKPIKFNIPSDQIILKTIFEFICKCGNEHKTNLCRILDTGILCHTCKYTIAKNKRKETNLDTYGVEWTMQDREVAEKIKNTNIKKYGGETPFHSKDVQELIKETHRNKRGVEYPTQFQEVRDKAKNTLLKNYGVEHPLQHPEIFEKAQKSSFKLKPYPFPSGKVVQIQGYENFALDLLLLTYKEEDILVGASNMPEIWYDLCAQKKRYYPDIYVPINNFLIEVKSVYTFERNIEMNKAKRQAALDKGFRYEIQVFSKDGKLDKIIGPKDKLE